MLLNWIIFESIVKPRTVDICTTLFMNHQIDLRKNEVRRKQIMLATMATTWSNEDIIEAFVKEINFQKESVARVS